MKNQSLLPKVIIILFLIISFSCASKTNRDVNRKQQILDEGFQILNSEFISGEKRNLNEGLNLLLDNEGLFLENSPLFKGGEESDTLAARYIVQIFNYLMRLDDPEKALEFNNMLEKRYNSKETMRRTLRKHRINAKLFLSRGDTTAAQAEISLNLKLLDDSIDKKLLSDLLKMNESEFSNLTNNHSSDNIPLINTYFYTTIFYFGDLTLVDPEIAKAKLDELSNTYEITEFMKQNILSLIDTDEYGPLWLY